MFDANALLNATIDEALDTRMKPLPEGEYIGQISKINPRSGTNKEGNPWVSFDVMVEVTGPVVEAMGLQKKTVKGGIMLDVLPTGALDLSPQKNIGLGRIRDALGQNVPGQPWSPTMMMGQMVKIKVKHRPDPQNAEIVYDEVGGWLRAG